MYLIVRKVDGVIATIEGFVIDHDDAGIIADKLNVKNTGPGDYRVVDLDQLALIEAGVGPDFRVIRCNYGGTFVADPIA